MVANRDAHYLPIIALPYWPTIGPYVEVAVNDCLPHTTRSLRDLYAAATPHVLWCWQSRGTALEHPRIFRASMIDQFIHLGMPGAARGSRSTLRSTLWRMAEILNPTGHDDVPHRPIPRSAPTRPYSHDDITELRHWAATQATHSRRLNARALLALGLGAGLAARELLDMQTPDVTITVDQTGGIEGRVVVWQGRTRVVPVHPHWVKLLRDSAEAAPAGGYLFRSGRTNSNSGQITDFLTRSRSWLDVRPARMRATWIIGHLEAGTPAEKLLRISGLKNYAALDRLMPFVNDIRANKS